MKKKLMKLVVCMAMSLMMVTPCFAATSDPVYEDEEIRE